MESFTELNKLIEATRFLFHFISWVEATEAFTDVTKLVEAFCLEEVLRLSQWEDCRKISVSIMLISLVLSQPIRIGYLDQSKRNHYSEFSVLPCSLNLTEPKTLLVSVYGIFLSFFPSSIFS